MKSTRKRYGDFGWELYHNEIGIHTFELQYQFDLNTESEILQTIWNTWIREKPHCSRNRNTVSVRKGLRIQLRNVAIGQIMKILVNPILLADEENGYLGIMDPCGDLFNRCSVCFDEFWKSCGFPSICMRNCKLTRVDLCMNIAFSGDFTVADYIAMLKRTPHKTTLQLQEMIDPEQSDHVFKILNMSRGLIVYDKLYEQWQSRKHSFDCDHLMRIEYQMYSRAIWELCKREAIYGTKDALRWLLYHSPELLCDGIQDCISCESYYSSEAIRSAIQKRKGWKPYTKEQMWQMQKDLYRADSFDSYFSPYRTIEGWKKLTEEEKNLYWNRENRLSKLLKRYRILQISPVALPKRSGILYLPSLYELARGVICNAMNRDHAG